jgi:SAM-dependent methyltransferase
MVPKMTQDFYRAFEDRFRGSRKTIEGRLRVYLPFIEPLKAVYEECRALDLGCGRGEWLELIQTIGFRVHGVDLDAGMLAACRERGLSVEMADAISSIESVPDESQTVVSGFHIAEHLPFPRVQTLVREALRVLRPGGILILETPNPENIRVGATSFYLDPTHRNPIPPPLLAFLPEHYGFLRTKSLRLQEAPRFADGGAISLLDVLEGASPDHAIVAQKTAPKHTLALFDRPFEQETPGVTIDSLARRFDVQLEKQDEHTSSSLASLRAELDEARSRLSGLLAQLNGVEAELNDLFAESRGVRARLSDLDVGLSDFRSGLNSTNGGIQVIRSELSGLHSQMDSMNATIRQITAPALFMRVVLRRMGHLLEPATGPVIRITKGALARVVLLFRAHPRAKGSLVRLFRHYPRLDALVRKLSRAVISAPEPTSFSDDAYGLERLPQRTQAIYRELIDAIGKSGQRD